MSALFNPQKPPRPPMTPTQADASVQLAGQDINAGYQSLISTSPTGLTRKARTQPRTLIGGAS